MARVLVTGSRIFGRRAFLEEQLELTALDLGFTGLVVVHGDCPSGADRFAHLWVKKNAVNGVTEECHPAQWGQFGQKAGPIRNRAMVDLGADRVLAFPLKESKGTWGCIKLARDAGLDVRVFD